MTLILVTQIRRRPFLVDRTVVLTGTFILVGTLWEPRCSGAHLRCRRLRRVYGARAARATTLLPSIVNAHHPSAALFWMDSSPPAAAAGSS